MLGVSVDIYAKGGIAVMVGVGELLFVIKT